MDRQIVFVAYEVLDFPYRRRITSIFQLTRSDRLNYRLWSSEARSWGRVEITTTDRLETVLADRRLRWVTGPTCQLPTDPPLQAERRERML